MTPDAISAKPKAVAADIHKVVERSVPDRDLLRDLGRQLLHRHTLLGQEPVVSSEEIVEAYFRCAVTDNLTGGYNLSEAAIPNCINSSHRAVRRVCASPAHSHRRIGDHAWSQGWLAIQRRKPEVNIPIAGQGPKRADLYIVAADGVVSVEFKYVGVAGLRDVGGCAAQLGRHAGHHAEAILVLYSSTLVPRHVVRQLAGAANVRILNVVGPEARVAKGVRRLFGSA
jgi:hypothetical protein